MDHCSAHYCYRHWCRECRTALLAYREMRYRADLQQGVSPGHADMWRWHFSSQGPGDDGGLDCKIVLNGLCEALGSQRLPALMLAVPGLPEFLAWRAKEQEADTAFEQRRLEKDR